LASGEISAKKIKRNITPTNELKTCIRGGQPKSIWGNRS